MNRCEVFGASIRGRGEVSGLTAQLSLPTSLCLAASGSGKSYRPFLRMEGAIGAGDGTRTRDNLLGRQTLYQTELLPQNLIKLYGLVEL